MHHVSQGQAAKKCTVLGLLVAQRLRRRTFDQAVVGSTPNRGIIKPPMVNSAYHPSAVGKSGAPALLAGVKAGCVRLCRVASKNIV